LLYFQKVANFIEIIAMVIRVNAHVVLRHGLSLFAIIVFGDTSENNNVSTMPYSFEK